MNKAVYFFLIVLVSTSVFLGCGESEKEISNRTASPHEKTTGKYVASDVDSKNVTKTQEGETTTGDAPLAEPPGKFDFFKHPLICSIVLFDDIASGKHTKLNKEKAKEMAASGKLLVVKSQDGVIFFVLNEDGTFATKRLAGYCNNKKIGIIGKTRQIDELNIIYAQLMESMD